MSSDESTSTESTSKSWTVEDGRMPIYKSHTPEPWEIKLIGRFVLSLYHRLLIGQENQWMVEKNLCMTEFRKFVTDQQFQGLLELNGTDADIGLFLLRCGFLQHSSGQDNSSYKLREEQIFAFRNKELIERDQQVINGDANDKSDEKEANAANNSPQQTSISQEYEIDLSIPEETLLYQGTSMQQRIEGFRATSTGCCICQENFASVREYEEHIELHNDEKDFEYGKTLSKFDESIFTISYALCKKSHMFCFHISTSIDSVTIEKIIVVQSRSLFYVHNRRVPYAMPPDGRDHFYVDSHLFTKFVEQPIILICHLDDAKDTRIIEQHHFMRASEFPQVHIAIKPNALSSKNVFKSVYKVPEYFPPIQMRDALKDDFIYEKLMKTSNEFGDYIRNGKIVKPATFAQTLNTLLQIEDMETIREYAKLVQPNVHLRHFGDDYSLKLVPQYRVHIENILTTFDEVILTRRTNLWPCSEEAVKILLTPQKEQKTSKMFVGYIQDVNSGRVSFSCYSKLDTSVSYTALFRPSRLNLRNQYHALEKLSCIMPCMMKFLFPAELLPKSPSTIDLQLYNKSIYSNPEQLQAVRNIAEGPRNDATYIIFGPPGTGKTTTLVEAILQVLKRPDTKILVSSSSNGACDELAVRLCRYLCVLDKPRQIARVYAQSCESRMDTVDDLLLECSNMSNGHFYPDIEMLHEYRVVVCTIAVVAKLATGKFGHQANGKMLYTHLFIDEVAAATELEALVPMTAVLKPKSCLIISGDNKQLGPVLKAKRAEELGLGLSLMDRLLARECYRVNTDNGSYDRSVQTRLRYNFRSHPAIVNLYSAMYYNHDLEAMAKLEDVNLVKEWHLAPSKEYPIIFHNTVGRVDCDVKSFSLYNHEELNVVIDYVKDLMLFGINGRRVEETDIGIISPYKKQYLRIREMLNLRKWFLIETGSVETFQGKEKTIIIVSFVRSNTPSLGFLDSPRRLNVTVSRAKSLLIMVGNAHTLSMNPDYEHIIKECQRHNTFIGRRDDAVTATESVQKSNTIEVDGVTKSLGNIKLTSPKNNICDAAKLASHRQNKKDSTAGKVSKGYKTDNKSPRKNITNMQAFFNDLPRVPNAAQPQQLANSQMQQQQLRAAGAYFWPQPHPQQPQQQQWYHPSMGNHFPQLWNQPFNLRQQQYPPPVTVHMPPPQQQQQGPSLQPTAPLNTHAMSAPPSQWPAFSNGQQGGNIHLQASVPNTHNSPTLSKVEPSDPKDSKATDSDHNNSKDSISNASTAKASNKPQNEESAKGSSNNLKSSKDTAAKSLQDNQVKQKAKKPIVIGQQPKVNSMPKNQNQQQNTGNQQQKPNPMQKNQNQVKQQQKQQQQKLQPNPMANHLNQQQQPNPMLNNQNENQQQTSKAKNKKKKSKPAVAASNETISNKTSNEAAGIENGNIAGKKDTTLAEGGGSKSLASNAITVPAVKSEVSMKPVIKASNENIKTPKEKVTAAAPAAKPPVPSTWEKINTQVFEARTSNTTISNGAKAKTTAVSAAAKPGLSTVAVIPDINRKTNAQESVIDTSTSRAITLPGLTTAAVIQSSNGKINTLESVIDPSVSNGAKAKAIVVPATKPGLSTVAVMQSPNGKINTQESEINPSVSKACNVPPTKPGISTVSDMPSTNGKINNLESVIDPWVSRAIPVPATKPVTQSPKGTLSTQENIIDPLLSNGAKAKTTAVSAAKLEQSTTSVMQSSSGNINSRVFPETVLEPSISPGAKAKVIAVTATKPELLAKPAMQSTKPELLAKPVRQSAQELLVKPVMQSTKPELLAKPVKQSAQELLAKPVMQSTKPELLAKPVRQSTKPELLAKPVRQRAQVFAECVLDPAISNDTKAKKIAVAAFKEPSVLKNCSSNGESIRPLAASNERPLAPIGNKNVLSSQTEDKQKTTSTSNYSSSYSYSFSSGDNSNKINLYCVDEMNGNRYYFGEPRAHDQHRTEPVRHSASYERKENRSNANGKESNCNIS